MTVICGAPRHVAGTPRCSQACLWRSQVCHRRFQLRQECPPRVWYSPEIDASKFTLHILSGTPGGFQWLKYILLMLCNATHRLGDGKRLILRQRVRGSIRAVRAFRNTRVFLTETRVVADAHNIFSIIPHDGRVEARFSLWQVMIGRRQLETTRETLCENVIIWQCAPANYAILVGDDAALDIRNTDNDLEIVRQVEEWMLHTMAKVHHLWEMWQGIRNICVLQTESRFQNEQMTAVWYISDPGEIINTLW